MSKLGKILTALAMGYFMSQSPAKPTIVQPYLQQTVHKPASYNLMAWTADKEESPIPSKATFIGNPEDSGKFSCKRRHFCPSCHQKRVVDIPKILRQNSPTYCPENRDWQSL